MPFVTIFEPIENKNSIFDRWLSYLNRDLDMNGANLRPVRLYFAGRLRIPSLPLEFGAEGNWGFGRSEELMLGGESVNVPVLDDLRFFFATTFDIGSLFSAVAGGGASSEK